MRRGRVGQGAMSGEIFISYRRSDAGGHAGRLHDRLVACFGADAVFYDLGSIDAGDEFPQKLSQAIDGALAILVLVGPDWLAELTRRADAGGTDFVRHEVQRGLHRRAAAERRPLVLPLLLGGAEAPDAAALPDDLRALASLNAMAFKGTQADWDFRFRELVTSLAALPGMPAPTWPGSRRRRGLVAGAALLAVLGAAAGASAWQARGAVQEAAQHLQVARFDLAQQRLESLPAPSRAWPFVRFALDKARLGERLSQPGLDWGSFATELDRLLAQAPQDADLLALKVNQLAVNGEPEKAATVADAAVAAGPGNPQAWYLRALVHDANRRGPQAEADYRRAMALAPQHPLYRANLGHALLASGRYDEAVRVYEPVRNYALAPVERAKAHWALGDLGQAAQQQRVALQLLDLPAVAGDRYNATAWFFDGPHGAVELVSPADKRCYAQLSLAATLRLDGQAGQAFPPAECPAPPCPVRLALRNDLDSFAGVPGGAAADTAARLAQALAEGPSCGNLRPPAS